LAGQFDAAAVGVHNGFAERQAEAAAAVSVGARFVGAVKALKYLAKMFRGDLLSGRVVGS